MPAFDAMARRRGASKEVREGFWNRVMPEPMYFSEKKLKLVMALLFAIRVLPETPCRSSKPP